MKIKAWGETDVGLKRSINQDNILIDPDLGLYVVADGMGGHKGGEVASEIAVKTAQQIIGNEVKKQDFSPIETIKKVYSEASQRIHHVSSVENPELEGMGTTMVMLLILRGSIFIGNVGDSRCYLYRKPHMWQLTEDHSLINEQIRAGVISEEDEGLVIGRNVITRSVGYERHVKVDICQRSLQSGESLLICSDGLCGQIEDKDIATICRNNKGKEVVKRCIAAAKSAGGDDNISVVYLEIN